MKKIAIIISPNYQDYAQKYLDDCLKGLRAQDYEGEMKIFITDNESSQPSFEFLKSKMPEAEITRNQNNDGFAKGCNDSIKKALAQGFEYVIIFNIDSEIDPQCVSQMVKVADSDPKIGAVQARMMLYEQKDLINSLGNTTHFLGFGYCLGYGQKPKSYDLQISDIHYASGTAVLYKSHVLDQVGLFDEEYWMYNEDQELPWRMWLAGYRVVLAPEAVVYNKYEFKRSIQKFYWMDRNRIISILKCYRLPTLLLIAPAFVIMEIGLILYSLSTGWFKEKVKVWQYFFNLKNLKKIWQGRKKVQALRKVSDRQISRLITGKIKFQEVDNDWKLRLVNPFFSVYWRLVRLIMFW